MGRINFKEFNQRESHDVAGVDSEMIDWAEYDDGAGNHVAHGDQSVLRMTQRCGRQPWATTTTGESSYGKTDGAYPLDTEGKK